MDATSASPFRPRRWVALIAGLFGAIAVIAATVSIWNAHVEAQSRFDAAATALDHAVTDRARLESSLDASVDVRAQAIAPANQLVSTTSDALVSPAARASLAGAAQELSDAAAHASELLADPSPDPSTDRPFWTWELTDRARSLDVQTTAIAADTHELAAAADALTSDAHAVASATDAVYASIPEAANALESANVEAQTDAVLDFREAARAAAARTGSDTDALASLTAYASAAAALHDSAQAELAQKAGPLLQTRLEIEAFARSLSGGVVLDFDWRPTVNGVGAPVGMAGTSSFDSDRGGFSTITLSDSVAMWWPSADAQALVVHEVGHSIMSKCYVLFENEYLSSHEAWATAWAISQGYTAPGNGTQAYGYPSQHLIDLASTCR